MGVMVGALLAALAFTVAAQEPEPPTRLQPVRYDANGWPIVPDEPAPRTVLPAAEPAPSIPATTGGTAPGPAPRLETAPWPTPDTAAASGMEFGSPLLEVFQFTRSPSAFKALSGRAVWWRATIHGPGGEVLGIRELTHVADCTFAERDRLEYEGEGRVYGRDGEALFAERQGMPWPSDAPRGGAELQLFGVHLRTPWCFGDAIAYAVMGTDAVERPGGERLRRVRLERRPPHGAGMIGPELDAGPRDRFELIYEPGTGRPRELVHRLASSGLTRRVLLDDWREYDGVRMPWRRTYVDDAQRATTTLEILDISPQTTTARTFHAF